jgi:hypothetical protein
MVQPGDWFWFFGSNQTNAWTHWFPMIGYRTSRNENLGLPLATENELQQRPLRSFETADYYPNQVMSSCNKVHPAHCGIRKPPLEGCTFEIRTGRSRK